jgi:hypothetical protein
MKLGAQPWDTPNMCRLEVPRLENASESVLPEKRGSWFYQVASFFIGGELRSPHPYFFIKPHISGLNEKLKHKQTHLRVEHGWPSG